MLSTQSRVPAEIISILKVIGFWARLTRFPGKILLQIEASQDNINLEDTGEFSYPPPPDLKKLKELDPETITQIHNLYFSDVYRYARYRLPSEALAEDIASETFIQLLEACHAGKGPSTSIRGWLMRTTSNLVNSHYRKHYANKDSELTPEIPSNEPGPIAIAEKNEQMAVLKDALQKLTTDQQNVLALRFGSGYSLAETAAVMGKKANAIKALQFRALASLSRQLGEAE